MVDTITTALSNMQGELLQVGAVGLGIGVAIFGLRRGWKLVKGFVS